MKVTSADQAEAYMYVRHDYLVLLVRLLRASRQKHASKKGGKYVNNLLKR